MDEKQRTKLLKQLSFLHEFKKGNGRTSGEMANAKEIIERLTTILGLSSNFVPPVQPLEYQDLDQNWKSREEFERSMFAKLISEMRFKFHPDTRDRERFQRYIELAVMPSDDAWISRKGVMVTTQQWADRLIQEAINVLEFYLGLLNRHSPKALLQSQIENEWNDGSSTDIVSPQTKEMLSVWDHHDITEHKIKMLKSEQERRRNPAPILRDVRNTLGTSRKALDG
jgi:hypothetical protein